MATIDLSRFATNFRKNYDGVRMQQGRVLTDDDFNESERIDHEDERRTRVHVIGATGSPDNGFLIANPGLGPNGLNFQISAGTLYLGGLRLVMHEAESYFAQRDWLRAVPIPPTQGPRVDLVYIEAWQQPVSAVEDRELFEVALGGPDTSQRIRNMRRVHVLPGVGTDNCQDAWSALLASLATQGTINSDLEFTTNATMRVTFDPGGNPNDLCSPPVQGGYLGAENQAIRVELIDDDHFTWGYDNAAPLYRVVVQTNEGGERRVIRMLTEPKDQAHWPLAGQIVEVLPWSAVLPNGEKLAETSGFLARIDGSYSPDTSEFSIDTALPAGFGEEWRARPDAGTLDDEEFFYLRVWNRGADINSAVAIPFNPGASVPLSGTGLRVTFLGTQRRATDFWIIAARPESPNRVLPWELEVGRGPHGYRRYMAPLGLIQWQAAGRELSGTVIDDCRLTFPPLTRIRTCCTFTVGDGIVSYGNFQSIQEAVNHLPPGGGEVCVLPGRHIGNVLINARTNVKVSGCGRRSILVPPPQSVAPLIRIRNSQVITITGLTLEASTVVGIELRATPRPPFPLERITLTNLGIHSSRRAAIDGRGAREVRIADCSIQLLPVGAEPGSIFDGKFPAIFLQADNVSIEHNEIICPAGTLRVQRPFGGIQIAGGSERVEIRRNRISGGNGNGITLGSIRWIFTGVDINPDNPSLDPSFGGFTIVIGEDGCPHVVFDPGNPGGGGTDNLPRPVSDGEVFDIRIIDNEIELQGMCGIAAARLPLSVPQMVLVRDLLVEHNYIHDCMFLQLGAMPPTAFLRTGYGGIALARSDHVYIRSNRIVRNGIRHQDAICGIFVRLGEALVIEANEILENGPLDNIQQVPAPGTRGGIVIPTVFVPLTTTAQVDHGLPAAEIRDNIVAAPVGQALLLFARGPVAVHGNMFTSRGATREEPLTATGAPTTLLGGAVVTIRNLGISFELLLAGGGFTGAGNITGSATAAPSAAAPIIRASGDVLFNDNQVTFAPRSPVVAVAQSSILIASLDDVSFDANQSNCDIAVPISYNTMLQALSVRACGNRFKESPRMVSIASATTHGVFMNSTADNHSTHCILATCATAKLTNRDNHSLLFPPEVCARGNQIVTNAVAVLVRGRG